MKLIDESDRKFVTTTCYVLDASSLITYIVYDNNGDWLFFGDEEIAEHDERQVSVQEILSRDETLLLLPNMEPGQAIVRNDADSSWKMVR